MKKSINSIYLSAAHKSSGKTILSIGLSRIFSNLNHNIRTFKKGPDYIDMSWLALASRNSCYNLDFNTQSNSEIKSFFKNKKSKFNLIEGNKGLYDGISVTGEDDNSAMSILVNAPVILIIDTEGITRGIAPLLQGYINFEKKCKIKGVILNKVKTDRHENKLINAINNYTNLSILGSIRKSKDLLISERHLGLIPPNENNIAEKKINLVSKIIFDSIDTKEFENIGINFKKNNLGHSFKTKEKIGKDLNKLKIGVFYDKSFGFYYQDDIEKIKESECESVYIDSIKDLNLPVVDGLFIGGGFPEINALNISRNKSLIKDVKKFIDSGGPCYAECGGLMYLSNTIQYKKKKHNMVGVIPGDIDMSIRPVGRGYVRLNTTKDHIWGIKENISINAHEFHHANITFKKNIRKKFAYKVKRGYGINGLNDGFQYKNLLANFSHLRHTEKNPWIKYFIKYIKEKKND